ncbi:PREDICTED: lymphocyte antigen 96 [Chaetura pelagica]|uniref:lymphocyte antigen 96 n=1 Tax=Chaetura pelagica TaxID=8897 RepID=UPI0005233EF1|nr:PREDICTED: lymphocyte antigen 96 [Chaetura pelagica]
MLGLLFLVLFTPGVSESLCVSSDLEMSYTFCDSMAHAFMINLTPCNIINTSVWKAVLSWIPRSDISFLKIVFNVWYNGAKALHWKEVLCSGADDKYSVCGALKGETIATTFDIKGARIKFPKGNYNIIVQAFSDDSENNRIICLNITMIVTQDAF